MRKTYDGIPFRQRGYTYARNAPNARILRIEYFPSGDENGPQHVGYLRHESAWLGAHMAPCDEHGELLTTRDRADWYTLNICVAVDRLWEVTATGALRNAN